jgi:hypothetical protein
MKTYIFQVYSNLKYGGEAKEIKKRLSNDQEASDTAHYLQTCCGWSSVCWYAA